MHQIYSEAGTGSGGHEITLLLWNSLIHCPVHNTPPLVPILSQMNPVHTFPSYIV